MDKIPMKIDAPSVALHPLVIINVGDHYTRVKVNTNDSNPMVIGAMVGERQASSVEIFNSYECIYEIKEGNIVLNNKLFNEKLRLHKECFPDHTVVGWYFTGNQIDKATMHVHKQMLNVTDSEASLLLCLDPILAATIKRDLPLFVFEHEFKHNEDGTSELASFGRVPFKVESGDAERVAVDQVAQAADVSGSATVAHLSRLRNATKMMLERSTCVQRYLEGVQNGEVEVDPTLLRQIKNLASMLPSLDTKEYRMEAITEYNDSLLQVYLAVVGKSAHQLNELVDHYNSGSERGGRMRFGGMH